MDSTPADPTPEGPRHEFQTPLFRALVAGQTHKARHMLESVEASFAKALLDSADDTALMTAFMVAASTYGSLAASCSPCDVAFAPASLGRHTPLAPSLCAHLGQLVLRMLHSLRPQQASMWMRIPGHARWLPLFTAAACFGHVDLMRFILGHLPHIHADPVDDKKRAIHYACLRGQVEAIKLLAEHDPSCLTWHASSRLLPIHFAAQDPSGMALPVVMELAPHTLRAISPNFGSALSCAAAVGYLDNVRRIVDAAPELVTSPGDVVPVFDAVRGRNMDVIAFLLDRGPAEQLSKQYANMSLLHYAAMHAFLPAVELFLR